MGNVTDRRSTGGQSPGDAPLFAWQAPGRQTAPQRLRRLDALVRELSESLPRRLAVERLGEHLQRNTAITLYRVLGSDEAMPVSESDGFGVDAGAKPMREVIETDSGFAVYDVATNALVSTVDVSELERMGRSVPSIAALELRPQLVGRVGALAVLQHGQTLQWLAISDIDAAAISAGIATQSPALVEKADGSVSPAKIVQPAGGEWPHKSSSRWSAAEREAMFRMRHIYKLSDSAIASVAGMSSRSIIAQQIGSFEAYKNDLDSSYKQREWRPLGPLLRACGLPVQPLQDLHSGK